MLILAPHDAALLPSNALTVVVLAALVGVGIYTLRRRDLGAVHGPRFGRRAQFVVMLRLVRRVFLGVVAALVVTLAARLVTA